MNEQEEQLLINAVDYLGFDVNPNYLIPTKISEIDVVTFNFDTTKDAKLFKQLLGKDYKGIVVKKSTVVINDSYTEASMIRKVVEFIREYLSLENNMYYE